MLSGIRCKPDEIIRALADSGGYIGICCIPGFLGRGGDINVMLDHIDHVVRLVGVEHVGLGSDVDLAGRDGSGHLNRKNDLDGIDYSKKVYDLTEGLLRRKYSSRDIQLILGGNFQRALSAIWTV